MVSDITEEEIRMEMTSTKPANRIFISYRRGNARGANGRIWDWLYITFGGEQIFRPFDSICHARPAEAGEA